MTIRMDVLEVNFEPGKHKFAVGLSVGNGYLPVCLYTDIESLKTGYESTWADFAKERGGIEQLKMYPLEIIGDDLNNCRPIQLGGSPNAK